MPPTSAVPMVMIDAEDEVARRRPGSKATPHGPLPQGWKCVWRVPRGSKQPGSLVKVGCSSHCYSCMPNAGAAARPLYRFDCSCPRNVTHVSHFACAQVYVSPAKLRYWTYKLAMAAASLASAPQAVLPVFELEAMVAWLRDIACSLFTSSDQLDVAMLLGVLRARGVLSEMRTARLAAGLG